MLSIFFFIWRYRRIISALKVLKSRDMFETLVCNASCFWLTSILALNVSNFSVMLSLALTGYRTRETLGVGDFLPDGLFTGDDLIDFCVFIFEGRLFFSLGLSLVKLVTSSNVMGWSNIALSLFYLPGPNEKAFLSMFLLLISSVRLSTVARYFSIVESKLDLNRSSLDFCMARVFFSLAISVCMSDCVVECPDNNFLELLADNEVFVWNIESLSLDKRGKAKDVRMS